MFFWGRNRWIDTVITHAHGLTLHFEHFQLFAFSIAVAYWSRARQTKCGMVAKFRLVEWIGK